MDVETATKWLPLSESKKEDLLEAEKEVDDYVEKAELRAKEAGDLAIENGLTLLRDSAGKKVSKEELGKMLDEIYKCLRIAYGADNDLDGIIRLNHANLESLGQSYHRLNDMWCFNDCCADGLFTLPPAPEFERG